MCKKNFVHTLMCALMTLIASSNAFAQERWTKERATQWYQDREWLVGCNYLPAYAINQLEMWQADTFDLEAIDRELGWAAGLGMNTVRVFLHDLAWQQDPEGFLARVDQFLDVAEKHKISPMIVIFDGVWDPDPVVGVQRAPTPGVHNSGWVQSPGREILANDKKQDELEAYVKAVVTRYAKDPRICVWDLFNEPDNDNRNSYGRKELENKDEVASSLVRKTFVWARACNPQQPLTVGVWRGPAWTKFDELNLVHQAALELSDVISFHDYNDPAAMQQRIDELKTYGRPLLCTEYMARGNKSTFAGVLPVLKQNHVAAYNWGFVDGKSQTKYPWTTWQKPITEGEPKPWHHDIFHTDGTPYSEEEVGVIKKLTLTP